MQANNFPLGVAAGVCNNKSDVVQEDPNKYSVWKKAEAFDRSYGDKITGDVDITAGFNAPLPTYDRFTGQYYNQEAVLTQGDGTVPKYVQNIQDTGGTTTPPTSFEEIQREHGLNNVNMQLLNDLLFRDVIIYENEPDGRLGLDKCLDNKSGFCVEYGQTGIAYYYPDSFPYDSYGELMNEVQTQREADESTIGLISYPNLR